MELNMNKFEIAQELEKQLLANQIINEAQLHEIRKMFQFIDKDKSGDLSYDEVSHLIESMHPEKPIAKDEIYTLISKIDINKDGVIEWHEFLQIISQWLQNFQPTNKQQTANKAFLPQQRKNIQYQLSNFFHQFKNDVFVINEQFHDVELQQDLEQRITPWSYTLGGQQVCSNTDKLLESLKDYDIKLGLQKILELLNVLSFFTTSDSRFQISHFITVLFDFIDSSIIFKILKFLANQIDLEIIYSCVQIITIFAYGPQLSNLNADSIFHPSKNLHKNFLFQNSILTYLLQYINSNNQALREQSILAMGFIIQNSPHIRDHFILSNAHVPLLSFLEIFADIAFVQKISWVLSLFAGVSQKKIIADPAIREQFLVKLAKLLYWKDDVEILINTILGLAYILPVIEITNENKTIWERVIQMLTHNSVLVKRACLFCIKTIMLNNETQCYIMVEFQVVQFLSELLNYNNEEIQLEIAELLQKIVTAGYSKNVMQDVNLIRSLSSLIYQSQTVRHEVVKIFCIITSFQQLHTNRFLLENGIIKSLCDNLHNFKTYDKVMQEMYGYMDPVYSFNYLTDCLSTMNSIVKTAIVTQNSDYGLSVLQNIDQGIMDKLQALMDLIFGDIEQKKINCEIVFKENIEFSNSMNNFLDTLISFFQMLQQNNFIANMTTQVQNIKKNFKIAEQNGNILSTFNAPINISLLELLIKVEVAVQQSPLNLYCIVNINQPNQKQIFIKDESVLKKLIESQISSCQDQNLTLNLIISNPMANAIRNYISTNNSSQIFSYEISNILQESLHTNLEKRETLIEELKKKTNLSQNDLQALYNSFINVTCKRMDNQNDGSVNWSEFQQIVKGFISDQDIISDLYKLLDHSKTGLVDFRDFICVISIMKAGSLEDKLRLAFKSYDLDDNGFLDYNELYQLMLTSYNISKVQKVFEEADLNKDGKLSFTEFKFACGKNLILLNPFWTDPNVIEAFSVSNAYFNRRSYQAPSLFPKRSLQQQSLKSPLKFF